MMLFMPTAFGKSLQRFDIDKQRADKALIAFARKTNQTIVFSFDLTKQFQANALKGLLFGRFRATKIIKSYGSYRCC